MQQVISLTVAQVKRLHELGQTSVVRQDVDDRSGAIVVEHVGQPPATITPDGKVRRPQKRYDVTTDTDEYLVRFGGQPFTLKRLAQLMDELEHGDTLTVTIMRQYDNVPA